MTDLRTAAQLALDCLEMHCLQRTYAGGVAITNAAITLREALAEPQEPWLKQALTDPENQPNQFGVKFLMHGPKFAFKVGVQQFELDYEPTEPGEFEFMRDMLVNAFSTFTPDVKAEQALQRLSDIHQEMEAGQKPVAWLYFENGEATFGHPDGYRPDDAAPLYTTPQPTKQPLTDEEIEAAVASVSVYRGEYAHAIARAIERAHGII